MIHTILVVDDDVAILDLLKDYLTLQNYDVYTATNAREALSLFDQIIVDLIITDIVMPDISGIRFIYELRKQKREVRIIAMSGGDMNKNFRNLGIAHEMGAEAILEKPFNMDELLATIRKMSD